MGFLASAAFGLEPLVLARPYPVLAISVAALIGFATLDFSTTLWFTALQQHIPKQVLSRVSSYDYLGLFVTLPLGYALAGPLARLPSSA